MEDAHIAKAEDGDDPAIFGVFDGHGGMFLKIILEAAKLQNFAKTIS